MRLKYAMKSDIYSGFFYKPNLAGLQYIIKTKFAIGRINEPKNNHRYFNCRHPCDCGLHISKLINFRRGVQSEKRVYFRTHSEGNRSAEKNRSRCFSYIYTKVGSFFRVCSAWCRTYHPDDIDQAAIVYETHIYAFVYIAADGRDR